MKTKLIKCSFAGLYLIIITGCASSPLIGTWQYDGGIYNGKAQNASPDFKMHRTYTSDAYEAVLLEDGSEPELYNSGVYEVKGDSVFLTSKYSKQPSQNTDIKIGYKFRVEDQKMTTNGVLPNGMVVEEYWKKVK